MKILIATPFYPPETEHMAAYCKELAMTLAERYEVSVVAYARLPEKTKGVRIFSVNKSLPIFLRLAQFTVFLFREARKADAVYVENGPSVELPMLMVSVCTGKTFFLHIADVSADARISDNFFLRKMHLFLKKRARSVIKDTPLSCPEILPFRPIPVSEQTAYRASWEAHIKKLIKLFHNV